MTPKILAGKQLLITRPEENAHTLQDVLNSHGALSICFPTITIAPPKDNTVLTQQLTALSTCESLIVLSSNAVRSMPNTFQWTALTMPCFAIGPSTKRALLDAGLEHVQLPNTYNSEGLLSLAAFSQPTIFGQCVGLLCGAHPRPLLPNTLTKRGAHIQLIQPYQRDCPEKSPEECQAIANKTFDAIICTSNDALQNLHTLMGETHRNWLCATPHVVVSDRAATLAKSLGVSSILQAENATDEAILTIVS